MAAVVLWYMIPDIHISIFLSVFPYAKNFWQPWSCGIWYRTLILVTIIARSLAVMVSGERQRASQVLYGEILYIEIRSWLSIKYTNIHKWPTHFLWPMNAQSCYASHQQGFITIPSVLKKTHTLFWIKDTFLLTLERRHFLPEPITRDRVFQNWPFHSSGRHRAAHVESQIVPLFSQFLIICGVESVLNDARRRYEKCIVLGQ